MICCCSEPPGYLHEGEMDGEKHLVNEFPVHEVPGLLLTG